MWEGGDGKMVWGVDDVGRRTRGGVRETYGGGVGLSEDYD